MQMVLPSGSKIIAMRQTGVAMGSMQNFTFSFSMRNGGVEIFHFQRAGAAVGTWFESRRGADRERIRPELVFGPLAVFGFRHSRGLQPQPS